VSHPGTVVTCTAPGDLKWVSMGLRLPPDAKIEDVIIGYEVSSPRSFIAQIRLAEMKTPDHATVLHDDSTPLQSTSPASHKSHVGGLVAKGAVTLELRLNFQNTSDEIRLGAVGVAFQRPAEHGVFDVRDYGAKGDGSTNDHPAIVAAISAQQAAGGGIVVFPPTGNSYVCVGLVSVPSSIVIQGLQSQDRNTTFGSVISFQCAHSGFVLVASAFDITIRDLLILTDSSAGPAIGCVAGCVASTIVLQNLKFILENPAEPAIAFGSYASPAQVEPCLIDRVNISAAPAQSAPLLAAYGVSGGLSNVTIRNCIFTSGSSGTLLPGTVTVTNGSATVTFSTEQTLPQGQLLNFSEQPSVCYEVASATSTSTTATLTQLYFGTTDATGTTTAVAELVHFESTDTNIITNIAIEDCEFEIPLAGAIKWRGVRNSRIINCWMGDLSPRSPIFPQIWIGKSTAVGAPPAFNITIDNLQADSGVQDAATVYLDAAVPVNQAVVVLNSTVPWVQNVPIGGPYTANQVYSPIMFIGATYGGYSGDQPTGILGNTFLRVWAHAEAPETLTLANGVNSDVTGTGNLRGAYRVSGPTGVFSIDGILIGPWESEPIDGVECIIYNPTSHTMIIVAAATSASKPPHQIITGGTVGDVEIAGPGSATVKYDLCSSKWILIAHQP